MLTYTHMRSVGGNGSLPLPAIHDEGDMVWEFVRRLTWVCLWFQNILESLSKPSLKGFRMECNGRFQFVLEVEKSWYSSTTSGYSYRYKDHTLNYNFTQICGRIKSYAMWIRFLKAYMFLKGFLWRVMVENTFLVLSKTVIGLIKLETTINFWILHNNVANLSQQ